MTKNEEYQRENLKQIKFKLNRKTEPELIAWLESQGNVQGYLKKLVRTDMEKQAR